MAKSIISLVESPESALIIEFLQNNKNVYFEELKGEEKIVFFYSGFVRKILKHFKGTKTVDFLKDILKNPKRICPTCETKSNKFFVTHRDVGGCFGKYIECIACKNSTNEVISSINEANKSHDFKKLEEALNIKISG